MKPIFLLLLVAAVNGDKFNGGSHSNGYGDSPVNGGNTAPVDILGSASSLNAIRAGNGARFNGGAHSNGYGASPVNGGNTAPVDILGSASTLDSIRAGNGARFNGGAPSRSYGAPFNGYSYGDLHGSASTIDEAIVALGESIPGGGIPGEDYPILASVPDTGFSCEEQEYPGYYADTADEAGCQVFHICQFDGRQDSFLCPNGTLFNQQYFVCDWWFNVDCDASEQFFGLNAEIGRSPEDSFGAASALSLSTAYGVPEAQASVQSPSRLYNSPGRF